MGNLHEIKLQNISNLLLCTCLAHAYTFISIIFIRRFTDLKVAEVESQDNSKNCPFLQKNTNKATFVHFTP